MGTLVFISHIVPENEVAIAFKELIEASFLGMIEVFVSSDEHSIAMGQRWLDEITKALKTCSIEIVLCSPQSVKRPWIHFEAGEGWIRDIPVIPLCHSGMVPSKLPLPLNLLQGATATEVASLNLILPVLARAIGSKTPKTDFSNFVSRVTAFEATYTFGDACNTAFRRIHALDAAIIPKLRFGQTIGLSLTETTIGKFEELMAFLTQHDVLRFERTGADMMTAKGCFSSCSLVPLRRLHEVMTNPNFKVSCATRGERGPLTSSTPTF